MVGSISVPDAPRVRGARRPQEPPRREAATEVSELTRRQVSREVPEPTKQPVATEARDPGSQQVATAPRERARAAVETKPRKPVTSAKSAKKVQPEVLAWVWPATGRVLRGFSEGGNKGLDISGRTGLPVCAAARGRVVYSGSGLVGYGKLIIVKHNKSYLSAYAHNDKLLVKEGDSVTGGQRIAQMGQTGTQGVKLHFEIRRDGRPVDPLIYLPRRDLPQEDSDA